MVVQFAKWGNSLAVRIPASYTKDLGISEGEAADMTVQDGKLVLKPLTAIPEYDIADLVQGITDENRHGEVSTGPSVGSEFC